MAYVAVNKDGKEIICEVKPRRNNKSQCWKNPTYSPYASKIYLKKGTINKLVDKDLTWEDEPVKI